MFEVTNETGQFLFCNCPHHDSVSQQSLVVNKVEVNDKPKGFWYCFGCGLSGQLKPEDVGKMSKKKSKSKMIATIDWYDFTIFYLNGRNKENYPGDFIYEGSSKDYLIGWKSNFYTIPMRNECKSIIGIRLQTLEGKKFSVVGSQLGLFIPTFPIREPVIICEGFLILLLLQVVGIMPWVNQML